MNVEVAEVSETSDHLLLSKEQLPNSNCCRFCGLGGRSELDSVSCSDLTFVPIYQKPHDSALETLDYTINRYLPIKVYENDPYYPKVICSACYISLERTMVFFDKIAEGQELLSKIINQLNEVKKTVLDEKATPKLFSDENPVLNAKKRRGRPRKDPNVPKISKTPVISTEYLERSKRHTRPPARYVASNLPSDEVKEEVNDAPYENNKKDQFLAFLDNGNPDATAEKSDVQEHQAKIVNKSQTDSSLITTMDSDFPHITGLTRRENLMDLVKLSVIMDGDEEIDTGNVLQLVESDNSLPKGTKPGIPMLCVDSLTPEEATNKPPETRAPDTTCNDNDIEIIHEEFAEEDEGSDTSVRLVDLIKNARRSVRKRQKVRKGKKKKGPEIGCADCDKKFSHPSSLLYHRVAVHDLVKKYVCPQCKKGFSHKQLLTNHLYTHMEEKYFGCDLCPSKFKSRASLYTHRKSIHSSKKEFTCEKCGLQFNLKSSLTTHMRLHTGEKPFACEFCQKRFAQGSNMREHRRTHTGERPYVCPTPDCEKSFATASQLRSHKLTHSGLKPFLCSVCGKAFANNENFKYHMRRHNGDSPLECPVCHKQFIEPWSLRKHWRLHTGEKPYECKLCKKVFSDPSNYSKHKKMHIDNAEVVNHHDQLQIQIQAVYDNADIPTSGETVVSEDQDQVVTELSEQIISAAGQIVTETAELGDENEAHSLEQILNGETFTTIEGSNSEGQSSVIYVLPGEVPIYTITIADEQTIEVRADDEAALQEALGTLTGGPITFASVDDGDIGSDYFDLETVDGTTTAIVPASQLSDLPTTTENLEETE